MQLFTRADQYGGITFKPNDKTHQRLEAAEL